MTAKTILLVDDSKFFLELEKSILEPGGYTFLEARDGETALRTAIHDKPDLILLDLNMPVMGGFVFLERLRADPEICNIPVIIVTVQGHEDDVKRALQSGADDFLTKPIDNSLVTMKVGSYLNPDVIRTTPRLYIDIPVIYSDFHNSYHGLIHDIGPGGMHFISRQKLSINQKLELSFEVGEHDKKRAFHTFGRVVQVRQRSHEDKDMVETFDVRVQFLNVKWEDFVFLEELVNSSTDSVLNFLMGGPNERQELNRIANNADEHVEEESGSISKEISRKLDELYQLDDARKSYTDHYEHLLGSLKNMQQDFKRLSFNYSRLLKHHYTALTMLHVISEQLSAQHSVSDILRNISDILENAIGADVYQVYIHDKSRDIFRSLRDKSIIEHPLKASEIEKIFSSCQPWYSTDGDADSSSEQPCVVIPIHIHNNAFGCIVVETLVPHRQKLSQAARQLIDYLSRHLGFFLIGALCNSSEKIEIQNLFQHLIQD